MNLPPVIPGRSRHTSSVLSLCCFHTLILTDEEIDRLIAKLFASENAVSIANKAIQVLGGHGYCQEYIVERLFRDARGLMLHFKTSEWLRQDIAKAVIGI